MIIKLKNIKNKNTGCLALCGNKTKNYISKIKAIITMCNSIYLLGQGHHFLIDG
jgi:hypothetical protein